jgi:hypothetical protein
MDETPDSDMTKGLGGWLDANLRALLREYSI